MNSQLYIDGEWRSSSSGCTFSVCNPASGSVVGVTQAASAQDVLDAIAAAQKAQPAWEAMSPITRRRVLFKVADLLENGPYAKEAAMLEAVETGAAKGWGFGDVMAASSYFREAGCLATNMRGDALAGSSSMAPGAHVMIEKRAHGVIFGIAPWNSAICLAARAIAIPLICGNTVVLKSSEFSPATHSLLARALHEAGVPKGCVNLLHMSHEDAPTLVPSIISDPRVRHVNFTGSDRIGRIIAMEAAKTLKPTVLELGGKAAAVVLDDANVKDAARGIITGAMLNAGQICMSTGRVIVQRAISSTLIAELTSLAAKIPTEADPDTTIIGSLFSANQAKRVLSAIEDAQKKGAEVLLGDNHACGAWVKPHILLGYKPGMEAWSEESFGPLLGVTVVDTVDEAVDLANETEYSLTSSLWTTRLDGLEIARRIRVGEIVLNGSTFSSEPNVGVHGVGGRSGYGKFDVQNFTREQVIVVNNPGAPFPFIDKL